jgi:hypothetical protein
MIRSYIRIYGPPVLDAIDALEGIVVELSKTTSIKFSHGTIPYPERLRARTIRGTRRLTTVPKEIVEHFKLKDRYKIMWILFKDDTVAIVPKTDCEL